MRHGNVARVNVYVRSALSHRFSRDSDHGHELLGTGVIKFQGPVTRVVRRNPNLGVAGETPTSECECSSSCCTTFTCGISRRSSTRISTDDAFGVDTFDCTLRDHDGIHWSELIFEKNLSRSHSGFRL